MNRYVAIFTAANVVLTLLLAGLVEILKLKSGTPFAVAAVFGSSCIAAAFFAKDHARAPTKEEKAAFAWRALACTWLVSLLMSVVVFVLLVPASDMGVFFRAVTSGSALGLGIAIFVFTSLIYYVAIRWSFGWYGNRAGVRSDAA